MEDTVQTPWRIDVVIEERKIAADMNRSFIIYGISTITLHCIIMIG